MKVVPVKSIAWKTDGIPLTALTVRISDLADQLGLVTEAWDVDGLGPARGFGCRLASGRLYCLVELALAVQYQGARGPVVLVDASEVAAVGVEPLVAEILMAINVSRSELVGIAGESDWRYAVELTAKVAAARSKQDNPVQNPPNE